MICGWHFVDGVDLGSLSFAECVCQDGAFNSLDLVSLEEKK